MPCFDVGHSGRVPDLMITERTRKGLLLAALTLLVVLVFPTANALAGPPTVQITEPASGSSINHSRPVFSGAAEGESEESSLPGPEVHLNVYKGLSAIGQPVLQLSAQPASDGSWSTTKPAEQLANGVYTAQATQTNRSGETGESELTFTIDAVPPQVTLTSPVSGSSTSNGVEQLGGAAGTPPDYAPTVTVELFAGATVGPQALEMLTVPVSNGSWSASLGGLTPGTYTVEAVQQDAAENTGTSPPVSFSVVTPSAVLPAASFTWVPANPTTGESVSLVSNSTDAASPISAFAWDVFGTGPFVAGAPVRTTSFATAGHHVVRLQVTDSLGHSSVVAKTINVTNTPLTLMQPFPIVRIAGSVTSSGVRISLLTVQAPVAANVTVMCKGHGCKTKSESRLAVASNKKGIAPLLAFKRFERRLPAGATLQIRVTKAGQIGKYTSFVIRRHRLPKRTDACLGPTNSTPIACPSS
jgi:Bacterial Ig-like domain